MNKEQFLSYIRYSTDRPERISESRWMGMLRWAVANGVSLPNSTDGPRFQASQSELERK